MAVLYVVQMTYKAKFNDTVVGHLNAGPDRGVHTSLLN